ncbi:Predicted protein [Taphrina deformans PYCC 5710]|uniref:Uncharacterized protein n=1 Tax=Taphrina deformans (strain PYCC 5710 / ATCC 11124 / CBS 356.35 / IMI 108563 / JCM 9778 / NBRC 8474) TaxID=1097556 RepID=R4XCI2_TAPDE|nr:Predicted protein [Taphrina deformans PYCC 5710]|eukprot:CCG83311.1 Predicted protein [Taphrina deformans PYCC 5710]
MTSGFGDFNPASRAKGFGIVDSTPRNGATREPFQVDTSIIRDRDMATAGVCGKTLAGGPNDVTAGMKAAEASGNVAQVRASTGVVTMTIHQVNADGKGPYTCMYSGDGTTFESMTVITDVPSEGRATATDFPLIAKLPSGVQPGAGMVRCRNNARAGPFGGCMAVVVMAA